jgi:hypothetical protein
MTIKWPDGDQEFRARLVQIQSSSKTSGASTNQSSWSDTGLSNRIFVMCQGSVRCDNSSNTGFHEAEGQARILRGSTQLRAQTFGFRNSSGNGKNFFSQFSFGFVDNPGSGNHTYKLQFGGGGNTFRIYVADSTRYHNAGTTMSPSTDLNLIEFTP